MHKNNKPDNELVPTRTNENARKLGHLASIPTSKYLKGLTSILSLTSKATRSTLMVRNLRMEHLILNFSHLTAINQKKGGTY